MMKTRTRRHPSRLIRPAGIWGMRPPLPPLPQGGRGAGGPGRSGATLTEVLVSLMIMSIGLVGLASMFPLSVLRSIKASQLTNSADLRYNVESLIDARPELITRAVSDSINVPPAQVNTVGVIIDPLGYHLLNSQLRAFNAADVGTLPASINPVPPLMLRHHGGTDTNLIPGDSTLPAGQAGSESQQLAAAEQLAVLPDSWVIQSEPSPADVSFPGGVRGVMTIAGLGRSGFTLPPSGIARAVFFNADRSASLTRTITNLTGDDVSWSDALPTNFTVGSVRIETSDRRYSWMLTVRKPTPPVLPPYQADIDVVVFFRRSFEYDPATDPAGNSLYLASFTKGSSVATITPDPNQSKPWIKAGGFVFDVDSARWYRIRSAQVGSPSTTILLEQPAFASSPLDGTNVNGKAMFLKGVVDVYPIGKKSFQ